MPRYKPHELPAMRKTDWLYGVGDAKALVRTWLEPFEGHNSEASKYRPKALRIAYEDGFRDGMASILRLLQRALSDLEKSATP